MRWLRRRTPQLREMKAGDHRPSSGERPSSSAEHRQLMAKVVISRREEAACAAATRWRGFRPKAARAAKAAAEQHHCRGALAMVERAMQGGSRRRSNTPRSGNAPSSDEDGKLAQTRIQSRSSTAFGGPPAPATRRPLRTRDVHAGSSLLQPGRQPIALQPVSLSEAEAPDCGRGADQSSRRGSRWTKASLIARCWPSTT